MRRSDPASEICTQSQCNSIMCSLRSGSGQCRRREAAPQTAGFYSKKAAFVELYRPPASDQSKKDLKVKSLQNYHTWPSTFPLNLRRVRASCSSVTFTGKKVTSPGRRRSFFSSLFRSASFRVILGHLGARPWGEKKIQKLISVYTLPSAPPSVAVSWQPEPTEDRTVRWCSSSCNNARALTPASDLTPMPRTSDDTKTPDLHWDMRTHTVSEVHPPPPLNTVNMDQLALTHKETPKNKSAGRVETDNAEHESKRHVWADTRPKKVVTVAKNTYYVSIITLVHSSLNTSSTLQKWMVVNKCVEPHTADLDLFIA